MILIMKYSSSRVLNQNFLYIIYNLGIPLVSQSLLIGFQPLPII
jgi:hypothetical protein